MDPASHIADWKPAAIANPMGVLDSPPTHGGLRSALFRSSMHDDGKARLLKGFARPTVTAR
ncbi:hypothetical protein OAN61_00700 [bacterium]|nr:hypothetical protein [bacterium]